jgi:hypothetical protein
MADRYARRLSWEAAGTFLAVTLAFAALDDITTDSAASFAVERLALAGCAAWLLVVAFRQLRGGHRVVGIGSIVLLVAAAIALPAKGVPAFSAGYLITVGTLLWFVGVAATLANQAWAIARRRAT